jgi:agmatine/peptidylarginine deiminase
LFCFFITTLPAIADVQREPVNAGDRLLFPEGAEIPRNLTEEERRFIENNPLEALIVETPPPDGPVHCVAEYEPMEGILIAWEGSSTFRNILARMGAHITTTGDADLYVVVDNAGEEATARTDLAANGVDMSRVQTTIRGTDTIWIRDYGPRYIYEGGCRAIVDHVYNRPRPNDDVFPSHFATFKKHAYYEIPLIHGGGNYHLDALDRSYASRLISNENPDLTEQEIVDLWHAYQNLDTTLIDPFPRFIDSTQHIDMWLAVVADDAILISDWPFDPGSTQDQLCDQTTIEMEARGYTVYRIPARSVGGTHYTYTNAVMCNDLVIIPSYTNPQVAPHNAEALSVWQAALPTKTIVPLDGEAIVSSSGVFHCIVMHVPEPLGGENPTVYLKNRRSCEHLVSGTQVPINWISDDDKSDRVMDVDILLSTDGGATFPTILFQGIPDTGTVTWDVPAIVTNEARLRIAIHDG